MKRQTVSVSRPTQATISDSGKVELNPPTVFEIKASIQPADRVQMEALPQLRDYKQAFTLFSNSELLTSEASISEADIVLIYGKEYEVVTVEPWQNKIRSHYKILVGR